MNKGYCQNVDHASGYYKATATLFQCMSLTSNAQSRRLAALTWEEARYLGSHSQYHKDTCSDITYIVHAVHIIAQ